MKALFQVRSLISVPCRRETSPAGKTGHLPVAFVGFAQGVGLVLVLLAVFVDGEKIVRQRFDGHEQVVDDKLDVAVVFPSQHGDEGHSVETA